jgi:hypothetical protein
MRNQVGGAGLVVCTEDLRAEGTCTEDADVVAVQLGSTLPEPWIFRAYYQVEKLPSFTVPLSFTGETLQE